jgi:hypothetical protein
MQKIHKNKEKILSLFYIKRNAPLSHHANDKPHSFGTDDTRVG